MILRTSLLAIGVVATVVLGATAASVLAPGGLEFAEVPVPSSRAEQHRLVVSSSIQWRGEPLDAHFNVLFRTGDRLGELPFGQLVDVQGRGLTRADGSPHLCNTLDGASLLQADGAIFSLVHGECRPGVMQLSRLIQDERSGLLTPDWSRPVDFSSVRGADVLCGASVSPWGTHLAGEEYDANARLKGFDAQGDDTAETHARLAAYQPDGPPRAAYDTGWIHEVAITSAEGATDVHKRYALGRFSHEQARVMPDRRTVYLTDDTSGGGFFLFLADRPDDLSVGTLYAARWQQLGENTGALSWISLGHADESLVAAALAEGVGFDDLFTSADPAPDCVPGLQSVNTNLGHECLAVQAGRGPLASRLETRRFAALRGATTEWHKAEGMALDAERKRLYLALARVNKGALEANAKGDVGGPDHMQLAPNPCGLVMGLDVVADPQDASGAPMDSEWVLGTAEVVVAGAPKAYSGSLKGNTCDLERIAGPDNLEFIPGADLLLVAEDSKGHENNALWAIDVTTGESTRIMTVPLVAEVAGLQWIPNLNGFGYLTVSVQDPFSDWDDPHWDRRTDVDPRSWNGYIGPFPSFVATP